MPIHSAFLKYFDEVTKCGSIRQAARNLYVASSAVNRCILKIEAELGVKLLKRSHSGVRLTAAGEQLAQHVDRTLADAQRTLAGIRTLNDAGPGFGYRPDGGLLAAGRRCDVTAPPTGRPDPGDPGRVFRIPHRAA